MERTKPLWYCMYVMETRTELGKRIAEQRKWIEEHGGNLDGYQERYGDPGRAKCYGDGGTRIYEADINALRKVQEAYDALPPEPECPKLKCYHFSFGNSSTGPIGFCAAVYAESKAEATELLLERVESQKRMIDAEEDVNINGGAKGIEYCNVYFGDSAAITTAGIDSEEAE